MRIKCQHGSNPENRKSQLSRLLACLFFFSGFVFPALKLQVFSQSFALTGEDQPESSPLAAVWALCGGGGGGGASMELFYTYATTHPAGPQFTTSCKTHFANELQATVKPAFIHSFDSSVNNTRYDKRALWTPSKTLSSPFKCVTARRRLSCNLHPAG